MTKPKSKTLAYGAVLISVAFLLLYPFKVTVVPVWTIQVVDTSGKPVSNMPVGQDWQHYSVEQESHWEQSITDENGYVTFPERVLRISVFRRIINLRPSNLPGFPHAGSGPDSSILVLAGPDYLNDVASYKGKGPPPSRVVLRKMSDIPSLQE